MVVIDGAYGEGGGQILRTAIALSAIAKKPVEIFNIRKGRKKPGLLPQHLTGIRAAAEICRAHIEGASLGSEKLRFYPSEIRDGEYEFNVAEERGSAGATSLVFQTIVPILVKRGKGEVLVKGGTHVPFSPIFDYMEGVLFETLRRFFRIEIEGEILKYGFYPVGGGEVRVKIYGYKDRPERLEFRERGKVIKRDGVSVSANLPRDIAIRQAERLLERIGIECEIRSVRASCAGTYLFIRIESENGIAGFSSLGMRGKRAERVADEVVEEYLPYITSSAVIDPHLADQLPIFSIALGVPLVYITSKITRHLLTNQWVINTFFAKEIVEVEGREGREGRVEIRNLKGLTEGDYLL